MHVLISGGGTGGHVYPALAVVQALQREAAKSRPAVPAIFDVRQPAPAGAPAAAQAVVAAPPRRGEVEQAPRVDVLYAGSAGGVEENLARRAGIPFRPIETGQLRGRAPWTAARNLWRMRRGAGQAARIVADFRPQVLLVTGGYVCVPVVWAAHAAGVPVLIYLPDVMPGLAIRLLSRLATRVAVSCTEALPWFGSKGVVTGYPVRADLAAAAADRGGARTRFGVAPDEPLLLVFGGSRGAASINRALWACLPALLPHVHVVHISGALDWPAAQAEAAALPAGQRARYTAFAYLHEEMAQALAAADLVVSRAGASVLGEFPFLGLPSILVPYPHAGRHQAKNAAYLVARGAAREVADDALASRLAPQILELIADRPGLAAMGARAKALARPDAATALAAELRRLAEASGVS